MDGIEIVWKQEVKYLRKTYGRDITENHGAPYRDEISHGGSKHSRK